MEFGLSSIGLRRQRPSGPAANPPIIAVSSLAKAPHLRGRFAAALKCFAEYSDDSIFGPFRHLWPLSMFAGNGVSGSQLRKLLRCDLESEALSKAKTIYNKAVPQWE